MASNPPVEMEDQTDEDFFDKLVDDDDFLDKSVDDNDFSVSKLPDLSEEFDKLNVDGGRKEDGFAVQREDKEAGSGESGGADDAKVSSSRKNSYDLDDSTFYKDEVRDSTVGSFDGVKGEEIVVNQNDVDISAAWGEISDNDDNVLMTTSSWGLDASAESSTGGVGIEGTVGGVLKDRNSGSGGGIKEVGWSSFYADSGDQGGSQDNGFYSDFFSDIHDVGAGVEFPGSLGDHSYNTKFLSETVESQSNGLESSVNYMHLNGVPANQVGPGDKSYFQDLSHSNYWEQTYPGWTYDAATGQWFSTEGYDANANAQAESENSTAENWSGTSNGTMNVSYLQQSTQSVTGTMAESGTTENLYSVDQVTDGSDGYPEHMVFDAQYPGWYYDTIKQEWYSLESYKASMQSSTQSQNQQYHDGCLRTDALAHGQNDIYSDYRQTDTYGLQNNVSQDGHWVGSYNGYNQQSTANSWHSGTFESNDGVAWAGNQHSGGFGSELSIDNSLNRQSSVGSFPVVESYDKPSVSLGEVHKPLASGSFFQDQNYNQANFQHTKEVSLSNDYNSSQKPMNYNVQSFQGGTQFSQVHNLGRSSAGRPAHALATFGFGGKLLVLKDTSSGSSFAYGGQDPSCYSISVLNLTEVLQRNDGITRTCSYTRALCQHSFPGPLVGGSLGTKDLNKWIDERIVDCDSPDIDYRKAENLKLLLSLLKVACQHYGKLRSPFGSEEALKEGDSPESAVAQIFASAKKNSSNFGGYSPLSHCFQFLPAAEQVQVTASEVQNLLVSGRRKEALQCAQAGKLWGPALILASQIGDQFYVDTVKQMALTQMVPGSPLRTLCLLIAGQPAEVFSAEAAPTNGMPPSGIMSPSKIQSGTKGMLEDWKENLAIIAANRTKDDELVIIHLGDCLWKERGEITAAHLCYLVAEANFESHSDTARMCVIGADHWKCPRTYASPEAIQRTELYEYSKVLGNSQFTLQSFQPHKIVYAHMLAEVGKISDSLKYCQALSKSLKNGRAPEVEMWKQVISSLEERIRMHQQGGYSANLAPGKIVGRLLNFFDNTAHRVVGGLPPPAPTTSQAATHGTEKFHQPLVTKVSGSQSTMAMSSLIPSSSMEPMSEWAGNDNSKMRGHNRSVSEPDFGRTPRQGDGGPANEMNSENTQAKGSASGSASRFPRFGFGSQILQRTVGLVLGPRNDKQAKLGQSNKFYYDEKLKRWVEEGAELPAEETALSPPPTAASFQNGVPDYNTRSSTKSEGTFPNGGPEFNSPSVSGHSSGIPPIPPSSNQFSARGRMGVRSRYVDTFNQGGGSPANLFQSPSVPATKPAVAANPKFFIPTPVMSSAGDQTMESIVENSQEETATSEDLSTPAMYDPYKSPSASSNIQRFPSMDNIPGKSTRVGQNGPVPSHSRRTVSWSGSFNEVSFPPNNRMDAKSLGEASGMSPTSTMLMHTNGGSIGDELDEVEL